MIEKQATLRERTRQAVRQDITDVAVRLFLERGYDSTTIDDIAGVVGMSPRSVFRYFSTKEDIVVGKFSRGAEEMLAALRARPTDELAWPSLRRMFDVIDSFNDPQIRQVQQMVFTTPALLSVYLRTLYATQSAAVEIIVDRAAAIGHPYDADDPTPRALVAAAFGCLIAAQETALDTVQEDGALAPSIDRAMSALMPLGQAGSDV